MGKKGKSKKKKKDVDKKEALREQRQRKLDKKAIKKAGKEASQNNPGGEIDLQEAIRTFQLNKAESLTEVVITEVTQPTPRSYTNSVVTSNGEVAIFGGEWWDGRNTKMYGDLLIYSPKNKLWKTIDSPNSPPPRSSHQIVSFRNHIYLFGGEYSTTDQFFHYKDLWRYEINNHSWEVMEQNGEPPSQRSGHRLIVWRHYIICFGGFYDVSREMKYYNDIYLYCLRERKWKQLIMSEHGSKPAPRSSACLAIYNDTLFVHGGFAEVRVSTKTSRSSQMTDMWSLELDVSSGKQSLNDVTGKWKKIGIRGIRPTNRTSMSCAVHKKRMIFFGGVSDASTSGMGSTAAEDDGAGTPHNDMYAFDMERKQFYMLALRGKKKKKKTKREQRADNAAAKQIIEKDNDIETKEKDMINKNATKSTNDTEVEEEEEEGDVDEEDMHDQEDGVVNTMDDLQDDKFYYILDGVLVEMDMNDEHSDEEEEENKDTRVTSTATIVVNPISIMQKVSQNPLALSIGDEVDVLKAGDWEEGVVESINTNGTYNILDRDDCHLKNKPSKEIRKVETMVEEMEQMEVREGETKTSKEVLPPQAPCTDAKGTTVVDTTVVDTTVVDTAVHTTDVGAFVSFIAAASFQGAKESYQYQSGDQGLGYYLLEKTTSTTTNAATTTTTTTPVPIKLTVPSSRFKASACVYGNIMYLYGGIWEERDVNGVRGRERLALDDLWSMDLQKLSEWELLHEDSGIGERNYKTPEDQDDKKETSNKSSGNQRNETKGETKGETKNNDNETNNQEEEEEEVTEEELLADIPIETLCEMSPLQRLVTATCRRIDLGLIQLGGGRRNRSAIDQLFATLGLADEMTTPEGHEKLRDFFKRTADHWIVVVIQSMSLQQTKGKKNVMNGKELRRAAFVECESRYHLLTPLIEKIYFHEKQQTLMENASTHVGEIKDLNKKEKKDKKKKDKKEKKKKDKKEKKRKKDREE